MNKLGKDAQEVLECSLISVVKFGAPWCASCNTLGPVLEKATELYPEINFYEVDMDDMELVDFANAHNIRGIPTTILFNYGKVVARKSGSYSLQELKTFIGNLEDDILSGK